MVCLLDSQAVVACVNPSLIALKAHCSYSDVSLYSDELDMCLQPMQQKAPDHRSDLCAEAIAIVREPLHTSPNLCPDRRTISSLKLFLSPRKLKAAAHPAHLAGDKA